MATSDDGGSPRRAGADALQRLLDADDTAVVLLDRRQRVTMANRTALALLGCRSVDDLEPGRRGRSALNSLLDHAPRHLARGEAGGVWQGDIDVTGALGEQLIYRATVLADGVGRRGGPLPPPGSPVVADDGFIGLVAYDVTFARDEANRLRHRATHDPLTGLANRRQILATLTHTVSRQRLRPGSVAAVFVDLDRLKYVNDALGHQVGDRLLESTARRLAAIVRPQDSVARIGGDEFLVVCADIENDVAAIDLAERIRGALSGRLRLRQLEVAISVSIGIALIDPLAATAGDAALAAQLVSHADTAMYEAKSSGRGRSVLFTPAMQTAARERSLLGAELTRAIDERRLTVDYQPIFSAVTGEVVAAEALARWHHDTLGAVDPAEFIAVAEQSATIAKLGQFVLEHAMSTSRAWREQGIVGEAFAVHVNVSPIQLASASFVTSLVACAREHGLRHHQLVLEVRQASLLDRSDDVDRTVRALRLQGVRLAIDNFGTGANALSVFGEVGADIWKLDASATLAPGGLDDHIRLMRAVVVLAHALDMQVVAERVGSPELLDAVRAAGCDQLQGNALTPAAPPDDLERAWGRAREAQ